MTLQVDGKRHQIIFENLNASELAFNFCKIYNLDFATMKYLKKCIKQIIQQFNNNRNNDNFFFFKDNNSIQEVAEEEIITENSLKKSGTIKNNNNNNKKNESNEKDEEEKIQNDNKENSIQINEIKKYNKDDNNNNNDNINNNNIELNTNESNNFLKVNNKKEKEIFEYDIIKPNTLEDDEQIEQKEYSIDYCLDSDSIEIFSPTEHTTKIEQRSSFRNNSSLLKKAMYDKFSIEKKKNSKNKKLQINNCNKTYNKPNYIFSYNKLKKEYNISSNKIISNPKDFLFIENKKIVTKKNSFNKKKPQSVEKSTKKTKIRTPLLELAQNNRKSDNQKVNKHKYKNKYEKLMTNINDKKSNKYYSNYYNYFLKSKNINSAFSRNNDSHKYKTNSSINQESNKSKSISQNKITKNLTQKTIYTSRGKNVRKKDKSMMDLNSLNIQKNSSKINLNTIIKNENYHSREKKKSAKNKRIKAQYNITYNDNIFTKNQLINKRSSSSKRKKSANGRELFIDMAKTNKVNSNATKKMVAASLLNIHKVKDSQEKKKHCIVKGGGVIKSLQIKKKSVKNKEVLNKIFRNDLNAEGNKNSKDKVYNEFRSIYNNNNYHSKTKRNYTEINCIQKNNLIKSEYKGRLLTSQVII